MSRATVTVQPVGWARKQDLLQRDPCFMVYEHKPAAENGHEPVALYTEDQLQHALAKATAFWGAEMEAIGRKP